MTDNDTLTDQSKPQDVYEDFSKEQEMFVFSNYSPNSKFFQMILASIKKQEVWIKMLMKEYIIVNTKMFC